MSLTEAWYAYFRVVLALLTVESQQAFFLLYSMLEFLPTTGKREADLGSEIFPFHPASRTVYYKSREIDIVITDMAYELACR